MVDQRAVRLLPQQPLLRTGCHQQLTVGQPIDGERDSGGHLRDDLAMPFQVEGEDLLGAPVRQPQAAAMPAGGLPDDQVCCQHTRFGHVNLLCHQSWLKSANVQQAPYLGGQCGHHICLSRC